MNKEEIKQILELRNKVIFCPKCGTKNDFSAAEQTQTYFFCKRCSTKISDYWKRFQNNKIEIIKCEICGELTFENLKYCISCGEIKDKVLKNKVENVVDNITKKRIRISDDKLKTGIIWSIIFGAIFTIFGFILSYFNFELFGWNTLLIIGMIFIVIGLISLIIIPLILFIIIVKNQN